MCYIFCMPSRSVTKNIQVGLISKHSSITQVCKIIHTSHFFQQSAWCYGALLSVRLRNHPKTQHVHFLTQTSLSLILRVSHLTFMCYARVSLSVCRQSSLLYVHHMILSARKGSVSVHVQVVCVSKLCCECLLLPSNSGSGNILALITGSVIVHMHILYVKVCKKCFHILYVRVNRSWEKHFVSFVLRRNNTLWAWGKHLLDIEHERRTLHARATHYIWFEKRTIDAWVENDLMNLINFVMTHVSTY